MLPRKEEDMSSFSEGQTHLLMDALERAGWTGDDLTKFGQLGHKDLQRVRSMIRGWDSIREHGLVEDFSAGRLEITAGGTSVQSAIGEVEARGVEITDAAHVILSGELMNWNGIGGEKRTVELFLMRVDEASAQFGRAWRNKTFLDDKFLAEWSRKNLQNRTIKLCNVEYGIRLAAQYVDQPKGQEILIAMRPQPCGYSAPGILCVATNSLGEKQSLRAQSFHKKDRPLNAALLAFEVE
jgi:hypothetical protein